MKGLKIAGIVVAIVAVIVLIIWSIRRAMIGKDVKTGVANDKIEEAAIASGIHPEVARVVANAPSTSDALKSIGSPGDVADAIAGGNVVAPAVIAGTMLSMVMGPALRDTMFPTVGIAKGDKFRNPKTNECFEAQSVTVTPGSAPGVYPVVPATSEIIWKNIACDASIK